MEVDAYRLNGRVALVTGAAEGIGRAICLELARAGADVAVSARSPRQEATQRVQKEIEALGRTARVYALDVRDGANVQEVVDRVAADMGRLDILVNNAGITRDGLVLRMSEENWDAVLDTNLKGAFLCTKAALHHMVRQRWGRIINISSVVGLAGNPGQANYTASKAGIIGLTRTLAKEVASRNITVNALAPGFIATAMVDTLSDEMKAAIRGRIAMDRFGTPEDVAHAVAFLASEAASYITGQVLGIDGGLSI